MAGKATPEYYLHNDCGGNSKPLLLCAVRKVALGKVKYVISTDVLSLYTKAKYDVPVWWHDTTLLTLRPVAAAVWRF